MYDEHTQDALYQYKYLVAHASDDVKCDDVCETEPDTVD
jgi:hypothetical protein